MDRKQQEEQPALDSTEEETAESFDLPSPTDEVLLPAFTPNDLLRITHELRTTADISDSSEISQVENSDVTISVDNIAADDNEATEKVQTTLEVAPIFEELDALSPIKNEIFVEESTVQSSIASSETLPVVYAEPIEQIKNIDETIFPKELVSVDDEKRSPDHLHNDFLLDDHKIEVEISPETNVNQTSRVTVPEKNVADIVKVEISDTIDALPFDSVQLAEQSERSSAFKVVTEKSKTVEQLAIFESFDEEIHIVDLAENFSRAETMQHVVASEPMIVEKIEPRAVANPIETIVPEIIVEQIPTTPKAPETGSREQTERETGIHLVVRTEKKASVEEPIRVFEIPEPAQKEFLVQEIIRTAQETGIGIAQKDTPAIQPTANIRELRSQSQSISSSTTTTSDNQETQATDLSRSPVPIALAA